MVAKKERQRCHGSVAGASVCWGGGRWTAGVSGGGGAGVGYGLARLVSMSQSNRARSGKARVDVPI